MKTTISISELMAHRLAETRRATENLEDMPIAINCSQCGFSPKGGFVDYFSDSKRLLVYCPNCDRRRVLGTSRHDAVEKWNELNQA